MKNEKLTYEQAMAKLEALVSDMENNELGIDRLCDTLEEVKSLLAQCRDKLYKTEEQVKKILEGQNNE
ncbi:MAG: exodeoxyribonuclease VII small subunit [Bacteroidaceae bacterium]|nr:exodeoxyribonuclease VII small subunit [Bacteroidaceae bacterium]MBR3897209.1 exodeoxyribonuclease VII small subunit [Bacteroidaceae bacterium]